MSILMMFSILRYFKIEIITFQWESFQTKGKAIETQSDLKSLERKCRCKGKSYR